MKKNIKTIVWIVLLVVMVFGFVLLQKSGDNIWDNSVNTEYSQEDFDKEVVLYNKILKESKSLEDIKKCGQLKIGDIKNTCISSIKVNFWDMSQAKTLEDCDKLESTENEDKEFRIDVCKYNLIKRMNKEENDFNELCWLIINEDVKNSCLSNFSK